MGRPLWDHKVKKPKDLTSREKNMARKAETPAKTGGDMRRNTSKTKKGVY